MDVLSILSDAFFAAIAGVGFGAVSNPPLKAFPFIAVLAAVGHAVRFFLMHGLGMDITTGSFVASFVIGWGSLWLAKYVHCPMTVLYIPALLPMVPGIYAYKIVLSTILFLHHLNNALLEATYSHAILTNSIVTFTTIFNLAVGATLPVFVCKKTAYSRTRRLPVLSKK